jgi:hypothetical protein
VTVCHTNPDVKHGLKSKFSSRLFAYSKILFKPQPQILKTVFL